MRRVIVTGANGFVGKHVIDALQPYDIEIHAISRSKRTSKPNKVIWHQVDLFDSGQVEGLLKTIKPDGMIHLAWDTTPGLYWTSIDNYRWVEASLCLVRLFQENGGRRVIVTGSCAEYDWSSGVLKEESTELNYSSAYSLSKNHLQSLLSNYAAQTCLSFAWARLFFLYGPCEPEKKLVPSIITSFLKKEVAKCTSGELKRDYLFVSDAAEALVALLMSQFIGLVNIGSGKAVKISSLVYKISELFPESEILEPENNSKSDFPLVESSINIIKSIGWVPKVSLDEGLRLTIDWWRERKKTNAEESRKFL